MRIYLLLYQAHAVAYLYYFVKESFKRHFFALGIIAGLQYERTIVPAVAHRHYLHFVQAALQDIIQCLFNIR